MGKVPIKNHDIEVTNVESPIDCNLYDSTGQETQSIQKPKNTKFYQGSYMELRSQDLINLSINKN